MPFDRFSAVFEVNQLVLNLTCKAVYNDADLLDYPLKMLNFDYCVFKFRNMLEFEYTS